jgi:hypothetical protein
VSQAGWEMMQARMRELLLPFSPADFVTEFVYFCFGARGTDRQLCLEALRVVAALAASSPRGEVMKEALAQFVHDRHA